MTGYGTRHYEDRQPRATYYPMGAAFTLDHGAGWFPACTIRVEVEELQKADIGRKFARKDKRPLDPPPVVRVRCFQSFDTGTGSTVEEEIRDYDDHFAFGLVCYVDLFPVQDTQPILADDVLSGLRGNSAIQSFAFQSNLSDQGHRLNSYPRTQLSSPYRAHETIVPPNILASYSHDYNSLDFPMDRRPDTWDMRPKVQAAIQPVKPENSLYPEDSQCTEMLSGATFIGCSLVDHHGSPAALFVFSDLAVKMEGRYILRYRVFNIHGRLRGDFVPVLAECYGGPFEIYSTKAFPGLKSSTDLTRKLSLAGVRVNSRTRERQGWKRTHADDVYSEDDDRSRVSPTLGRGPRRRLSAESDESAPGSHESFAGDFAYAPPTPLFPGLGQSRTPPASLLAWARRNGELHDVPMNGSGGNGSGDAYSTSTEDGSSTHSLW